MTNIIGCLIQQHQNGNNIHLNIYAKVEKPKRKCTQVNTIEYDVESCEVMKTIGNCTYVRLKILEILTNHSRNVDTVYKCVTKLKRFKYYAISSM